MTTHADAIRQIIRNHHRRTDTMTTEPTPAERLEYLRAELRAERISQGELIELQGLAEHIHPSDVELLEAAGVPEFEDDDDAEYGVVDITDEADDLVGYGVYRIADLTLLPEIHATRSTAHGHIAQLG